jgi:hypothetical protein
LRHRLDERSGLAAPPVLLSEETFQLRTEFVGGGQILLVRKAARTGQRARFVTVRREQ